MSRRRRLLALYKGDEFIGIGTNVELAKILNCKPSSITHLSRPAYKKRLENRKTKNALIAIKLEFVGGRNK